MADGNEPTEGPTPPAENMTPSDAADGTDGGSLSEPADAAKAALTRARAAARSARPDPRRAVTRHPRGSTTGRDPVLAKEVVRDLLADRGWSGPAAVAGVAGQWAQIVGDEIAAHVKPDGFDVAEGRLLLRADSTTWATVIRLQVPRVSDRIAEQVGAGVVRSITVLGPAAPSWRHGQRTVRGRGPRDTYG